MPSPGSPRSTTAQGSVAGARDTQGKKMPATFLYSATRSLFEEAGFSYDRPKGKFNCVMHTTVSPT